jgi:thiol:disulfide interchange protein
MHTRRLLLVGAALAALSPAWAAPPQQPDGFDPGRDAAADVAAAVTLAAREEKRVLVEVGGKWCTWCHVLDRFFRAHDDVRRLRDEHYVWVSVNWSPQNRNEALLSRWPKITGYPHLFVLNEAGQLIHSQATSELEAGNDYDREKMLAFLRDHRRRRSP